ncbi:hypothetical protein [Cryobacterium arcticum]|uniref:hypothetical protein n=1 Tax=Cryobacterium arcticum TaxID=670052 RepID=UPI0015E83FE0|nr:hypothetical protein [Cryobacterium arcticum]
MRTETSGAAATMMLAVPAGVTLLELAEPVYRYDVAVTRASSAPDVGLQRLRGLLATAAAGHPALR